MTPPISNCGNENETSPSLHAGNCPVWADHHNLSWVGEAKIAHTFPTAVHVAVKHSTDRLESARVTAVARAKARHYARQNGFTGVTQVSMGWTLGPRVQETRVIFSLKK